MNYTKKVAYNTAAQMIGKVVGTAVSLATVALLFRYFGVEGIGQYTTVFAFVAFFGVFADFGFQWTLLRELAINKNHDKVFKNIFAFRLILAIVVHGAAFALVWLFNYPLQVKIGVGIITLAQFFLTINSTMVSVFLNNYRLDITVIAEVIGRIITLILVWILTRAQMSFSVVLASYLAGNFLNLAIDTVYIRRFVKFGLSYDGKYWKYVLAEAFPIGIVLVFGFIYYKVDSIMLSVMKTMVDVGIYGTAYKLLEVLQVVPVMFLGAAFPLLTGYVNSGDERIKSAFQKEFDFLVILAVPIVVGVYALAVPIIQFIAGGKSAQFVDTSTVQFLGHAMTSISCLKILIFSVGLSFITNLYTYLVVSLGQQKKMVWPTIGLAAFNVLLNLLLIPRYSYLGSAVATLATEVLVLSANYIVSRRFMKLPIRFGNAFRVILAGLTMGAFIYLFRALNIEFLLIIVLAAVIYVATIFFVRAITVQQVRELVQKT